MPLWSHSGQEILIPCPISPWDGPKDATMHHGMSVPYDLKGLELVTDWRIGHRTEPKEHVTKANFNTNKNRKCQRTYRKDLTSSPLWRICSTMWSQLPGFDLDRPAPVPLYRDAPAALPRTPRGPPRWPPPPGPVCSWPRLWEVTGGSLGPGGGWCVRGCWRLCCRTRGRGRVTAEEGMCSRVEAEDREASPKLSRYMGWIQ